MSNSEEKKKIIVSLWLVSITLVVSLAINVFQYFGNRRALNSLFSTIKFCYGAADDIVDNLEMIDIRVERFKEENSIDENNIDIIKLENLFYAKVLPCLGSADSIRTSTSIVIYDMSGIETFGYPVRDMKEIRSKLKQEKESN